MTRVSRGVPWLLATCSALVQAHGATSSGHLMWLAPIPWGAALVLACRDLGPGRAARRGFALGALVGVLSSAHLWGIAYYHGAVYALVLVYHALVWGGFSAFAGALVVVSGASFAPYAGAAWAFVEGVRSLGGVSFPFFFGGTLAGELPVAQLASVVGTGGLSGLLFWVGFALGGVLARAWGEPRFASRRVVGAALATALAGTAWGAARLALAHPAERSLRVSALQGAVPSWMYSFATGPGPYRRLIEEHYGFLFREAMTHGPDLVLFPETTFDWHILPTTEAMRKLSTFSATHLPARTAILFGASFTTPDGEGSSNGVGIALADATGRPALRSVVTKHQLVPFIELGHSPSRRWQTAIVGTHVIGVMICYESMYPESALDAARRGAELLTILSDDGGMRYAAIAWTHAEQARMRAIEAGLPLVRAGQVGVSYATDAYGRVLGRMDAWETGALTRDVPLQNVSTIYRRLGQWLTVLWAAIAAVPFARRWRARARETRPAG